MAAVRPLTEAEQAHIFATRGEPAPPPRLPATLRDPGQLGEAGGMALMVLGPLVVAVVAGVVAGPVAALAAAAVTAGILAVVLAVDASLPVSPDQVLVPAGVAVGAGLVGLAVRLVAGGGPALAAGVLVGAPLGALVGLVLRRATRLGARVARVGVERARRSPAARRAVVAVQARIDWFSPEVDGPLAPDLVGSPGRVRWALPAHGRGKAVVAVAGGGRTVAAVAERPVPAGALVRVVAVLGDDEVVVEPV